jgi:hypothetical protein
VGPQRHLEEYAPEALSRYEVIAGHHGILPLGAPGELPQVVTILREPAARAWSHYWAVPWAAEPLAFADFLDHPVYGWAARDYQACWLGVPPAPGEARWKPAPGASAPERELAAARRRSPLDVALHERAGHGLDRALSTLPALPADRLVALPYRQTMAEPLCGTGWYGRVHTPDAGWHRWTGPGLRSWVRLPVRPAGPARLALAIVSACDDDAVRSLRLAVQGRHLAHVLEPRRPGVAAVAEVELDPRSPLTIELEVAHTRGEPEPAGLAIGEIALS